MSNMKKLLDIMNEMATVSGSIAAGPAVGLGTQRRVQEEDSDDDTKAPDAPKAKEFGLWKNSVLAGAEQRDKKKSKKSPVAESESKLYKHHQELRKKSGLPHPDEYKSMMKTKQSEIDALRAEIEADKQKQLKELDCGSGQRQLKLAEDDLEEGWKNKLAGAALAGAAALGGGGHAQAAPTDTGSNATIVKSLVNPAAQQRFAAQHADTTAKLSDPRYDHNPDALSQHNAYPKEQHDQWIQNVKNVAEFDNPYQIIRTAMNMAGVTPQEVLQNLPKGFKLPTTEPKGTFVPKGTPRNVNELDYGSGQRQLKLAEENISEEQLLAKELARRLDLFMKGMDRELGKKSADRDIIKKTEPSTGAMRENKKSIGPDMTDPYEQGWFATFNDSNPYEKGTKEHQQWQNGQNERESQPNHYDESVTESAGDEINDDWFKQGSFTAAKKSAAREPFRILNQPEVIKSLEGDLQGRPGDYVITGPKGEEYLNNPATFKKLKIDNGDGTASPKAIPKQVKLADHDGTLHTSWGDLTYTAGNDYIVRHGTDDYGAVKKDIFPKTYDVLQQDVAETTGDTSFDSMMGKIVKGARYKGAKADQQADAAYGDMMNNITKNAADVTKPSTNSKFEQVYSAVEKILLSSNVHWDIDDDISDALAKLKIKANDKLIQKLERELINRVSDALQFYDDSDLMTEATGYKSQFPSAAPAIQYAKDKVKTFRDPDDGIEVWSMPDGGCDVVHTSNSNGRYHVIDNRGKKLGTIYPQKPVKETSNYGDLDEVAPPGEEKLVRKLKKEYPGHPEKAFATAWSIYNKKHGKK